ncbi:MAG: GatB/YqeY domain-containing protein [Nocardioidaceae bacterium]
MSSLKDQLREELTASMKARDELRSSTLRMVLTAITTAEVAGKQARELTDDDVTAVLASEGKKRRESATAFGEAGRTELADKEQAEAAIIAEFLPEPLSGEEIVRLVADTIDELGAAGEGMRGMGRVMGALAPQIKSRADGGQVSAEVRRQLAGSGPLMQP